MSIFLCRSSHFPGCIEFSTLSASLLSDGVLQHHDSYIPVEAIPIYVEELLLLLTCYVEGTS